MDSKVKLGEGNRLEPWQQEAVILYSVLLYCCYTHATDFPIVVST